MLMLLVLRNKSGPLHQEGLSSRLKVVIGFQRIDESRGARFIETAAVIHRLRQSLGVTGRAIQLKGVGLPIALNELKINDGKGRAGPRPPLLGAGWIAWQDLGKDHRKSIMFVIDFALGALLLDWRSLRCRAELSPELGDAYSTIESL